MKCLNIVVDIVVDAGSFVKVAVDATVGVLVEVGCVSGGPKQTGPSEKLLREQLKNGGQS